MVYSYHTKASFRAVRESIGLTQQNVADHFGITTRTVKRWEHPDWGEIPDDAWEYLENMWLRHDGEVERLVKKALKTVEGTDSNEVTITYYRDQNHFNKYSDAPWPVGFANAVARDVERELLNHGVDSEYEYPDD